MRNNNQTWRKVPKRKTKSVEGKSQKMAELVEVGVFVGTEGLTNSDQYQNINGNKEGRRLNEIKEVVGLVMNHHHPVLSYNKYDVLQNMHGALAEGNEKIIIDSENDVVDEMYIQGGILINGCMNEKQTGEVIVQCANEDSLGLCRQTEEIEIIA